MLEQGYVYLAKTHDGMQKEIQKNTAKQTTVFLKMYCSTSILFLNKESKKDEFTSKNYRHT